MQCNNAICSLDCATECKRHQLLNALCAWLCCRGAVVYETMTNTVSFCEDEVKSLRLVPLVVCLAPLGLFKRGSRVMWD